MQRSKFVRVFGVLCGTLFVMAATAQAGSGTCLPFFDFSNERVISNVVGPQGLRKGPVDITPEPIRLAAFDEAVLRACGDFGSRVNPLAVRKLADNFSPDLLKELLREFPEYTAAQMRALLGDIWTRNNGFEHVFCGQPKRDKIGGLHYAGRQYELQQKNIVCRLENNLANEEILPQTVYTVGIQVWNGVADRKKGFSPRQSAEDIFFEAARTFLRNCRVRSKDRVVCNNPFYKDGSFYSLFVCTPNAAIVTAYPVARPARDIQVCR